MSEAANKDKDVIARLFSPSSTVPRKRSMAFDPTAESFNATQQKKKKSVVRPVSRDVIFLPEPYNTVPQKRIKAGLSKQGRIKSLVFKRTMTPLQVKTTIICGFQSLRCPDIKFLTATRDNKLVESPELSGEDVCGKRGTVYVYQCVEVILYLPTYWVFSNVYLINNRTNLHRQ